MSCESKPPLILHETSKVELWAQQENNNTNKLYSKENQDSLNLNGTFKPSKSIEGLVNDSQSNSPMNCEKTLLVHLHEKDGRSWPPGKKNIRSMKIDVVLIGKKYRTILEETKNLYVDASNHIQQDVVPVQSQVSNSFHKDGHCKNLVVLASHAQASNKDDFSKSVACFEEEDVFGDVLHGNMNKNYMRQDHYREIKKHEDDNSICNLNKRGGNALGHILQDEMPTSTPSKIQCNKKDIDGEYWGKANWCEIDSYMTSHGKETTWTVRGFEDDNGIFEESVLDYKNAYISKQFANTNNPSCKESNLLVTNTHIEGPNVETLHGLPPKWTQQALEVQVAKNLQDQHKEFRSSKKRLKMVRTICKKIGKGNGGSKENNRLQSKSHDLLHDDLLSIHDMFYYSANWKKVQKSSQACIRSSIHINKLEKARKDTATMTEMLDDHEAKKNRDMDSKAIEMYVHLKTFQSEVQQLQTLRKFNVQVIFPWQQILKNIFMGISLVLGTLNLHLSIKSLFWLIFGQSRYLQTASSRKGKTMAAMVIMFSGSYISKEMWQIYNHVQTMKNLHESLYQKKLCDILERIAYLFALIRKKGPLFEVQN
ncbi:uncharacterized protein [Physcomitrium patens]|nr:uncharacterized protein LOC112278330 isoform X5 [Physcomitrium patens]|eukprot:XP_024367415.1 uncharacterized protein LOC112278330 isoform X5 [Physcomitrella patens]